MGQDGKDGESGDAGLSDSSLTPPSTDQRDISAEMKYERGLAVKGLAVLVIIIVFIVVRQLFFV